MELRIPNRCKPAAAVSADLKTCWARLGEAVPGCSLISFSRWQPHKTHLLNVGIRPQRHVRLLKIFTVAFGGTDSFGP
jgi:hypothetical protein